MVKINDMEAKVSSLKAKIKEMQARAKKYKELKPIVDLVEGKFTHFVRCGWEHHEGEYRIVGVGDVLTSTPYGFSLLQNKLSFSYRADGKITWILSESNFKTKVIPCRSKKKALQVIQKEIDCLLNTPLASIVIHNITKTANIYRLNIPAEMKKRAEEIKSVYDTLAVIEDERFAIEDRRRDLRKQVDDAAPIRFIADAAK